jgi:hypothetical protein
MMIPRFPAPFPEVRDPKKSAFLSEGKMNKARPCTAASKQSSKMANKDRLFRAVSNFTVLRFGASRA